MVKKTWAKLKRFKKRLAARRRAFLAARPHRSFKKTRPNKKALALVTVKQNTLQSLRLIWQDRRLLGGLMLIYAVLTYIFVGGIAQSDFMALKDATLEVLGGSVNSLGTIASLVSSTMAGAFSGGLTELQQFLSLLLGVFFWLGLIWALRMRHGGQPVKIRDALYNSGAPVAAYLLVGLFIILQLTPGAVGLFVLNVAQGGGFLQGGVEVMMFSAAALLLCSLSIYWLSASLVALVVVTLPQMYPWRAMQIASELAIGRRLRIVGHILALSTTLILMWALALFTVLMLDGWLRFDWLPLLPVAAQALGAWTILYAATYIYRLYRSML